MARSVAYVALLCLAQLSTHRAYCPESPRDYGLGGGDSTLTNLTRIDEQLAQPCHWTGDCTTPGCGNQCIANLFPAVYLQQLFSDAAYASDEFVLVCPEIAVQLDLLAAQVGAAGGLLQQESGNTVPGVVRNPLSTWLLIVHKLRCGS
jgi:hypothetical protein